MIYICLKLTIDKKIPVSKILTQGLFCLKGMKGIKCYLGMKRSRAVSRLPSTKVR